MASPMIIKRRRPIHAQIVQRQTPTPARIFCSEDVYAWRLDDLTDYIRKVGIFITWSEWRGTADEDSAFERLE